MARAANLAVAALVCSVVLVMQQQPASVELAFAHGGAADYMGREPAKPSFHPFRAHAFPTQAMPNPAEDDTGRAQADARLESLAEVKALDPKMHAQAKVYRELTKCMQLAKSFKGTRPGQRKVTAAQKKEALECFQMVKGKGKAQAHTHKLSSVVHSPDYLFREVKNRPKTQLHWSKARKMIKENQKKGAKGAAAIPHVLTTLPSWDDKAHDDAYNHKFTSAQVERDVKEWEGIGTAHVKPPSRGRSTRESTGTTTHYYK